MDGLGRLDSVKVGGTWNELYHDASGQLVGWNQGSTKIRRLVWDGGNLLTETNGAITTQEAEYSYVPGNLDVLHAYIDGAGTEQHYAHHDGTGSLIATVTSGEALRQSLTYDEWGKKATLSEPSGYEQRSWWKGALAFDRANEFNLTYMRARWYDPDLGRFMSEDPIGLVGGINKYVFAGNDPVNGYDPFGLDDDDPIYLDCVEFGIKIYCEPFQLSGVTVVAPWTGGPDYQGAWGLVERFSTLASHLVQLGVNRRAFGTAYPSIDLRGESLRTPQECFDQSIAPARDFASRHWEAIVGTAAIARVVRYVGTFAERRGTQLRNFKGRPGFGRMGIVGGRFLVAIGRVPVVVGAGFASSYGAATSVICDLGPDLL